MVKLYQYTMLLLIMYTPRFLAEGARFLAERLEAADEAPQPAG